MKRITILLLGLVLLAGCEKRKIAVESIPDLAHARVGVMIGSICDQYLEKTFPEAEALRMDVESDLYLALDNGKVDAMLIDESSYLVTRASSGRYRSLGRNYTEEMGVGFRHGDPLREQFNTFLAGLRADGTYDSIQHRWFGGEANPRMPRWDDVPAGPPLKIGTTGTSAGFSQVTDGVLEGFDVEMLTRFARSLGRKVEFQCLYFGGLIAALGSGSVDIISSGITITEERCKTVAFSDSYLTSGSVTLVLADKGRGGEAGAGEPLYGNLGDAARASFAVITGNLHDKYVTENMPGATVMRYDTYTDVMMSLDLGNSDVACVEGVVYDVSLRQKNRYEVIGTLFDDPYGVGFNKKDAALREDFNRFLAEMKAGGEYEKMRERWIDHLDTARMPSWSGTLVGKALRVGCTGATGVFDFVKDGRNSGFDIELSERFGRYLGRPVEFVMINFGGLIAALSSGKVDMIISAITITEERARQIAFSDPYFVSQSIAIVLRERYANGGTAPSGTVRDGSDVATARIGAMTGTTGEKFIKDTYPDAGLQVFDDVNDAIMSLTAGKSDYVLTMYTTALTAAKKDKRLVVLPTEYIRDPSCIAFRKGNDALKGEVEAVLAKMKADGTVDGIVARWIRPDGSDYEILQVPEATEGEPLRVAVAANREPISFIAGGKFLGMDCELIRRIAYELGRPVEFHDMKFSALIAALESGRADVSFLTSTPERAKRIDFSDNFFTNPQVMLTFAGGIPDGATAVGREGWLQRVGQSFYDNLILENRYMLVLKGLWQTVLITFFATLLGTVLGGGVCALRMSRRRMLTSLAGGYINLVRGTPVLVLLMILFYIVFASSGLSATFIAILTFALNMAAYSSEMFRTAITGVDRGQKEAGIALGFTKVQTFIHIIMPQAVRGVLPVYKGEVISMLKMTSVVGYIAVVDLTKASDIIRSRTFDAFFPLLLVAVIYFVMAWLLGVGLDWLNRKIFASK